MDGRGRGIPRCTAQGDELYFTSELHAWKWNDWHNCPTFTYGSYPRCGSTVYQRGLRNRHNYDWGCNYRYYCLISVDFVFRSFAKEGVKGEAVQYVSAVTPFFLNCFARWCLILNLPDTASSVSSLRLISLIKANMRKSQHSPGTSHQTALQFSLDLAFLCLFFRPCVCVCMWRALNCFLMVEVHSAEGLVLFVWPALI